MDFTVSYVGHHRGHILWWFFRTSRLVASGQIEFQASHNAPSPAEQDKDILLTQRRRREVLPPMWDVYEKVAFSPGKENSDSSYQNGNSKIMYTVTHRRYIISKGAFPCSLCKRCFRINQGEEVSLSFLVVLHRLNWQCTVHCKMGFSVKYACRKLSAWSEPNHTFKLH